VKIGDRVEVEPDEPGQKPFESRINFISPRLDEKSQLLLVRAPIPDAVNRFRNEQLVHARVVWSDMDAIVVPFGAVSRLAGQVFAFVAEKQGNGSAVAKQRRLNVGEVSGNGYIVLDGLKPGEDIIVTNTQILGEGMPVQIQAAPGANPTNSNDAAKGGAR